MPGRSEPRRIQAALTQKDVANTAFGISSGATIGTIVNPGFGSVVDAVVSGVVGVVIEKMVDRKPNEATLPSVGADN
jgi:outer membrane protein with glycine zipper